MKKHFKRILVIMSLMTLLFTFSCTKDAFEDSIYQEQIKDYKINSISLEEFNEKFQKLKKKPKIESIMTTKLNNKQLRTTSSDIVIYTDEIKEISQGDYTSYTMYMSTPDTINANFYNITIEDRINSTTIFITKYSTTNNWNENQNQNFTGTINTYKLSEDFDDSSNLGSDILTHYTDIFGEIESPGGSGADSGVTSGSSTYPWNCNGNIITTEIIIETNCGCGHNWQQLLNGTCTGCQNSQPTYPSMSIAYSYQCIPLDSSINNPSGNTNGDSPGGSSSDNNNSAIGSSGTTTNTSITTIVGSPDEECVQPTGDLNGDCMLDNDEAQYQIFYNDLTAQQQQVADIKANETLFFNYLIDNDFDSAEKEFLKDLILNIINSGLNLDIEKSLKSPANIDFSAIDTNTPEGSLVDCIYKKLMNTSEFKELFTDVFGDNEKLNVKFEFVTNLPINVGASTGNVSWTSVGNNITNVNQTIKLNRNWFTGINSKPDIKIAMSILHECIHAYLNVKHAECNSNASANLMNVWGLDDLINETFNTIPNCEFALAPANQQEHYFMFDNVVPKIATILAQLKDDLISAADQATLLNSTYQNPTTLANEPFNWTDFFKYLAMDGLNQASGFVTEITNEPLEDEKYNFYSLIQANDNATKNNCND